MTNYLLTSKLPNHYALRTGVFIECMFQSIEGRARKRLCLPLNMCDGGPGSSRSGSNARRECTVGAGACSAKLELTAEVVKLQVERGAMANRASRIHESDRDRV